MPTSTIKVVVCNTGVMKASTIGCGYISVKELFDQNRGGMLHNIIFDVCLLCSFVYRWYVEYVNV